MRAVVPAVLTAIRILLPAPAMAGAVVDLPARLSVEEAVNIALRQSPLLRRAQAQVTQARGITMKGVGLNLLWQPLLMLAAFTVALYAVSAWRFRGQLH